MQPKMRPVLGLGLFVANMRKFWGFWGTFFWVFLGHIVEFGGAKWLFGMRKSSYTCSVPTVSLYLAVISRLYDHLGEKGCIWYQTVQIWGATLRLLGLAPVPRGASGECLAQALDLARALPRLHNG